MGPIISHVELKRISTEGKLLGQQVRGYVVSEDFNLYTCIKCRYGKNVSWNDSSIVRIVHFRVYHRNMVVYISSVPVTLPHLQELVSALQ